MSANGKRETRTKPDNGAQAAADVDWSLLSPQGRVLFYIALCPNCSVEEISESLGLTERAVWGVMKDLRKRNMVILRRDGRRHRYQINLDAPLLHPTINGLTLRPVLGELATASLREPNENCVRTS